jgi:hypothetical protein
MPRLRRRRQAPIPDPLAPLSDRFLRRRAAQDVRAQIDPLVAETSRRINASAAAGAKNIEGVTGRFAEALGGYEQRVGDIYGRSREQLGALNTETANRIAAAGQSGGEELRKRLSLSGVPLDGAHDLAAAGAGASAASFAHGGAELAQLAQNEASGRTFAAALPGLARMQGAQDIAMLRSQKQRELRDSLSDINSESAGLIGALLESSRRQEFEKATAARAFGLDQRKFLEEQRQFNQEEARRIAEANEEARANRAREGQNRQNEAGRNQRAKKKAASEGRTYNEGLSRAKGHAVDGRGRPIIDQQTGRPFPYVPASPTGDIDPITGKPTG